MGLAQLDHPNIVRMVGTGEVAGDTFNAMEFVEGTLEDRLLRGPLPHAEVVRLTLAIASALEYARARAMISNLAPRTIQLDKTGVPKLTDFHRAADTVDARKMMFSPFMAKEELVGTVTPATDVYRVGAVMYAMLTGVPPFGSVGVTEVMMSLLERDPTPPRQINPLVSEPLEAICLKCLEKRPDARYPALQELIKALEPLAGRPERRRRGSIRITPGGLEGRGEGCRPAAAARRTVDRAPSARPQDSPRGA